MRKKRFALSLTASVLAIALLSACSGAKTAPAAGGSSSSVQDDYPTKPIHIDIATAAGGAIDTSIRQWQKYAEKELGQPLTLDFYDGAGGVIGANILKKAEPDGYTIGVKSEAGIISGYIITPNAGYDINDFEYLGRYSDDPSVMIVKKDAPFNNLNDLIEYAKTHTVTISVANITDITTIGLSQIEKATGVKFNIIPYNSGNKARIAVVNGEVTATYCNYFGAQSIWNDTKVLAIHTNKNGIPSLEGVQTVNDALGTHLEENTTRYVVQAPKGFQEKYPQRAEKLIKCLTDAWSDPDYLTDVKNAGQEGYVNVVTSGAATQEMMDLNTFINANKALLLQK